MFAVNRSTASIWARKSASSRLAAIASGLVTSFWNDDSWKAQPHQRLRRPAEQPVEPGDQRRGRR